MTAIAVYETSRVKRPRRTNAEIAVLEEALIAAVGEENPTSVRHAFYVMTTLPVGIPKTEAGYDCVQRRLLLLRRRGAIPYYWISDGTRFRIKPESYGNLGHALQSAQMHYRRDLWRRQPAYVEIWCESDSVAGVIQPVTQEWDVPLLTARGFSSESYLYTCGQELADVRKPCFIYYFGDYDPSGLLIPEKIEEGLRHFAPEAEIHFTREAVTADQIALWNLPGRPPKATDSRAKRFWGECVEIEAIPASQLRQMVTACIEGHIDSELLARTKAIEAEEQRSLEALVARWQDEEYERGIRQGEPVLDDDEDEYDEDDEDDEL